MGGNALKGLDTRRVGKNEYMEIRDHVIRTIRDDCQIMARVGDEQVCRRIEDILFYRDKDSFGDLDVLVETFSGESMDWIDKIRELFSPKQIAHNSNCYSFDYKDFQIDLILTPTDDFDTSYVYFAWNDLGNLMGRVYKKLGFKYGHKGLSYIWRNPDNEFNAFAEYVISKDMRTIFEFGDFDYDRYMLGFDTLEEIFKWVSASKYFNPQIYLLDNRNYVSRTRDKKRKVYNLFLQWCADTDGLNQYPWVEMRERAGYHSAGNFFQEAIKMFPDLPRLNCNVLSLHDRDTKVKSKFNGEHISKITGLHHKELGIFIQNFMFYHEGKNELYKKLHHMTQKGVDELVLCLWSKIQDGSIVFTYADGKVVMEKPISGL